MAVKLLCALLVLAALQANATGVQMGVKMLDLDRMAQDLVEADEGNAQNLNEIEAYGDGHVDHLEQLSRELEMEDKARAHVGAMLNHESNHFNKISAEDPRDVRMQAQKEQHVESDLLSRLDQEIAHAAHKKGHKQSNKVAEKPVAAHKAAHISKRTHQKAAAKTTTKQTKMVKVIDDAQDQENAIIRLHQEEQQQGNLVDLGEASEEVPAADGDNAEGGPAGRENTDGSNADEAPAEVDNAQGRNNAEGDNAPGSPPGGADTDGSNANEAPKEGQDADQQAPVLKEIKASEDSESATDSSEDDEPAKRDSDDIPNHKTDDGAAADPITEHSEPKSEANEDANGQPPKSEEDGVPNHYKEDNATPEATKSQEPAKPANAFSSDWSFGNFLHQTN